MPYTDTVQIKPVFSPGKDDEIPHRIPAIVLATGYVDTVDRSLNSFTMITKQFIEGGSIHDELSVQGMFESNDIWPEPARRMPNVKGLITITGTLKYIHRKQTYVTIGTISYLDCVAVPRMRNAHSNAKRIHTVGQVQARQTPRAKRKRHCVQTASSSAGTLDDEEEGWSEDEVE